jgi:aminopeptidase N
LSARTRAQLVSDSFSLSQATQLDATIPLELIKYMSKEIDYLAWNVLLSRVKFYTDMLGASRLNGDMQMYLTRLVEPYYKKLDWDEMPSKDEWLDR